MSRIEFAKAGRMELRATPEDDHMGSFLNDTVRALFSFLNQRMFRRAWVYLRFKKRETPREDSALCGNL